MPTVKKSIEVDVPVRVVYDQWTQFEEFPRFMEGVEEVQQLDDKRLHWRAKVAGKVEEWDAEITEQVPDKIVTWRSTSGARNEGIVRFVSLGETNTKVELEMHWEPKDVTERIGEGRGGPRRGGPRGRYQLPRLATRCASRCSPRSHGASPRATTARGSVSCPS